IVEIADTATTDLRGRIEGDVGNDGQLTSYDGAAVAGTITNTGALVADPLAAGDVTLNATRIDNHGSLDAQNGGAFILRASEIVLRQGGAIIGDVLLQGGITNYMHFAFNGPADQLYGDFRNEDTGIL